MTTTSSDVSPTHRWKPEPPIEAWQYDGQPYDKWPDWVRSRMESVYRGPGNVPKPKRGFWALRDDEGYFWKWMRKDMFDLRFEPLSRF